MNPSDELTELSLLFLTFLNLQINFEHLKMGKMLNV